MKRLKRFIGMKVCDFGLWFLSLGPKIGEHLDEQDKQSQKELRKLWKKFKDTQ